MLDIRPVPDRAPLRCPGRCLRHKIDDTIKWYAPNGPDETTKIVSTIVCTRKGHKGGPGLPAAAHVAPAAFAIVARLAGVTAQVGRIAYLLGRRIGLIAAGIGLIAAATIAKSGRILPVPIEITTFVRKAPAIVIRVLARKA